MAQAYADQLDYDAVQSLYDDESMYTPAGKELLKKCLICFGIINPFDVGYHLECCKTAYIHDVCHRRRKKIQRGMTVGAANRGTKRLYRRKAKVDDGQRCPHCRKPNAMLVKFTDHMQYMDRVKVNCPVEKCNKLMTSVDLLQHYSECKDEEDWPHPTLENMSTTTTREVSQCPWVTSSSSPERSNELQQLIEEIGLPSFDDENGNEGDSVEEVVVDVEDESAVENGQSTNDNPFEGLLPAQIHELSMSLDDRIMYLMDLCQNGHDPIFDDDIDESEMLAWNFQQQEFAGL